MKNSKSIIDLLLINKPLNYKKARTLEIVASDYHKMITFFKVHSTRFRPKAIFYRNFNELAFFSELHAAKFEFSPSDPNQNYNCLTRTFLGLSEKHTPLKKKFVRGNHAPFMNGEFQKEI